MKTSIFRHFYTNKLFAGKNLIPVFFLALIVLINSCSNAQTQNGKTILSPKKYAQKIKENASAPVVDVRTPEEFSEGHLQNALNINWNGNDFQKQISALDKSKPVFVYCRSGRRSGEAAAQMRKDGFKEVYELEGGILKWEEEKLPAVK